MVFSNGLVIPINQIIESSIALGMTPGLGVINISVSSVTENSQAFTMTFVNGDFELIEVTFTLSVKDQVDFSSSQTDLSEFSLSINDVVDLEVKV